MPNEAPKPIEVPEDNDKAKFVAELYLSPEVSAARVIGAFGSKSLDGPETAAKIKERAQAVIDGDLSQAEAMLINQAHSLQAMFANLAERAQKQTYLPQVQCLMGLALKAQAQCRATLQTLVEVKFPKSAAFIRQANIAHQQQWRRAKIT